MEEIIALPYSDPQGDPQALGPEAGETTRAQYDNVDDFCGKAVDADAGGVVKAATGTNYPTPFQRFARTVSCNNSSVTVTGLGGALPGLTVTVTVTDGGDPVATLSRFVVEP